jgi:hypothetical protein
MLSTNVFHDLTVAPFQESLCFSKQTQTENKERDIEKTESDAAQLEAS